ncbi:MAG: glycoside hydrolase family 10 protein, partial [Planctomycetota bacterium]
NLDPLAYGIERSPRAGLQLHAWFIPFRCWHPAGKGAAHKSHVTQRAPQLAVRYGKYQWMDPGNPVARKWSLAVIQDVVRRYDIDGVHIDDYFYPYPENKREFPDAASYAAYANRVGAAAKLSRDDWRRQNIDSFVEQMYRLVHEDKPWVMVGISPFGIARPGVPEGIQAGLDQYGELYADVPKWLQNGWLDYLSPQLYWPIDQKPQAFAKLLDYWHSINPKNRAIWPGLYTSKIRNGGGKLRATELADEIEMTRRKDRRTPGHVHFSYKALRDDHVRTAQPLRQRVYRRAASVPELPWLPRRK